MTAETPPAPRGGRPALPARPRADPAATALARARACSALVARHAGGRERLARRPRSTADVPAVRRRRASRSTSSRCSSPTSRRSWPAGGRTRSCCRRSAMLGGISLLLMERLPQDLVSQTFFGTDARARAGPARLAARARWRSRPRSAIVVRSDSWLRRYKYTWAAAGVGLLLLTFVFGTEINGQRLTLQLGPLSGQPTELLKVILVVFLAGYLSENRALLVEQDTRRRPAPPAAGAVSRSDGRDVGDRPRASSSSSATSARRCCSSASSWRCSTSRRAGSAWSSSGSSCSSSAAP